MKQNSKWFKIGALSVILALGLGALYNYLPQQQPQAISFFEEQRDLKDIHNIFKNNWYWLIASFPTYEPQYVDYMFKNKAAGLDPRHVGSLNIKVLRDGSELVGFVAYYMENWYEGRILFLAVNEKFRGKGYAEQLMKDAFGELKTLGATKLVLLTRVDNVRAQKIYNRLGFKEIKRDKEGFVHFEKLAQ